MAPCSAAATTAPSRHGSLRRRNSPEPATRACPSYATIEWSIHGLRETLRSQLPFNPWDPIAAAPPHGRWSKRGLTAASNAVDWHEAQFALAGRDGLVRVFATDGTPVATLTGHQSEVTAIAFSPDGKRLVSGGSDGTVRVWDRQRGVELAHYRASESFPVHRVSFAPDGRSFV